jgi:hypothetical protein
VAREKAVTFRGEKYAASPLRPLHGRDLYPFGTSPFTRTALCGLARCRVGISGYFLDERIVSLAVKLLGLGKLQVGFLLLSKL